MHKCQLYGHRIDSDIPLDGGEDGEFLNGVEQPLRLTRTITSRLDRCLPAVGAPVETHGRVMILRSESDKRLVDYRGSWSLEVEGVVVFGGTGELNQILYAPLPSTHQDIVEFWFIHHVLPLYLSFMKGWKLLHASSVEKDGESMLFFAPSHGGKSTLAEYFVCRGHNLVSDDKVVVGLEDDCLFSHISHSRYRPYRRYEDLGKQARKPGAAKLPIGTLFCLQPIAEQLDVTAGLMAKRDAFKVVQDACLFADGTHDIATLKLLGALASKVTMYRLFVPGNKEKLPQVYEQVLSLVSKQR